MKVGFVSPYFGTIGGGERYIFTAAKFFLDHNDEVDIFSGEQANAEIIANYFSLDLSRANFVPDIFFGERSNMINRLAATLHYDLMVFLSNGSVPATLAKTNWLHFQTPFSYSGQRSLANKFKLKRFQAVICNSQFTKEYIDRSYGVDSVVVYPPVDVETFKANHKKENIILSTGRFSDPENPFQHAKKQEVLIEAFKKLYGNGLKSWQLVLAGSAAVDSSSFLNDIREMTGGLPIKLVVNPSFKLLNEYYASAKIFWHAAGFGDDLERNPARAEHFGMATVEAMASGAVPVVFAGGGQKEVVENSRNGFLWQTTQELAEDTMNLINNAKLLEKMSTAAQIRAKRFDSKHFFENLARLLE